MSRSAEFGLGSHFIEKDPEGNETERSAVEAVGGDLSTFSAAYAQKKGYRDQAEMRGEDW